MATETFQFQAEINQLLSLIINTFYSNKEVFLRELISNASDALDKLRLYALTNSEITTQTPFGIKIWADKENKKLIIEDNGIGMSKDELVKNLGTIAHSGTRAFMEALKSQDVSLIGQFGVGFYSAFLVADHVQVISKSFDNFPQYTWESNASGTFHVSESNVEDLTQGTRIILHLKEDQLEYLEESRIREIVKKHSQYCTFPISFLVTKEVDVHEHTDECENDEEGNVEDVEEPPKTEKKSITEFEQLNTQAPIWHRKPEDVTQEEYDAFFKSISNEWQGPLAQKHFKAEGNVEFECLLFIPQRPPMEIFATPDKKRTNVKLYVKHVLITEDMSQLLPDYFSFFHGVVDSNDLPLNVSREMLQKSALLNVIKKTITKKCIELISELPKDKFETFYQNFSKFVKLGVHEDSKNRDKLAALLRYPSTKGEEVTLKDYIGRMKPDQTKIYYLTGESLTAIKSSPFLERLKKRDIEVLYMCDPMDEYMAQSLREYDGKQLACISKDDLELPESEEEKKEREDLAKEWQPVCDKFKKILGERIVSAKVSDRLCDAPCVLVSDKFGWSPNMERIAKAQALRDNSMQYMMSGRRVLEINPTHPVIANLKDKLLDPEDKSTGGIVEMLYSTVLLDSGYTLDDPSRYAKKIYNLMLIGLGGEPADAEEPVDLEEPVEESLMEEID